MLLTWNKSDKREPAQMHVLGLLWTVKMEDERNHAHASLTGWQTNTSPVLEVDELLVDFLNVNLRPGDVVVAIDILQHGVVQLVEFLQQVEFFLDAEQIRVVCDGQAKQLLTTRVSDVLAPQLVKLGLEDVEAIRGLSWGDALFHGTTEVMLNFY